ncbi:GH25 family lysozyme [Limosilactobacillus fermentum]|uniref:GH25 family lysozyme n=1 Tax=Limosilactobacillus fermentum TaxID=1613 RepID=UPI000FECC507|nr:GH25 family lysozyme [Limosilactobacillus fermentum]QAR22460.1 LysM peptidoglycan-binding domain-containing protein [Limosilactobacillus fermentum]
MKHKRLKQSKQLAVALAAAFLLVPVATGLVELNNQQLPVVQAAKGDQGVDWSKYQGNNGKWGSDNDKFSISQIGGYYNGFFIDQPTYGTQVANTIALNRRAHTYIYAQFSGRNQADQMLDYYLPKIQTPKGSIVMLDVESGSPDTDSVLYALKRVQDAGFTAVLYGYRSFLTSHLDLASIAKQYPLALAEYPDYNVTKLPNYNYFPSFNNVGIFQFTSTYIAGGLDGDVDLTGITDNGYKNGNPQKPKSQTPAVQQGKQIHKVTHNYTIRYGDSWWGIANRYGLDMNTLAQMNGTTINAMIYPGQVIRVGYPQHVNKIMNNDHSGQSTWTDALGDTWHKESGTFTSNTWLHLRWGARVTSAPIGVLPPGSVIKYDAYSRHGDFVWLRQPRGNGQYGYVACRDARTNEAYGSFE